MIIRMSLKLTRVYRQRDQVSSAVHAQLYF